MSIEDRRKKLFEDLKKIRNDYNYIISLDREPAHSADAHRKLLRSYFKSGLDKRFFDLLYAISAVPRKVPRRKDLDDYFRPGSYPHCLK